MWDCPHFPSIVRKRKYRGKRNYAERCKQSDEFYNVHLLVLVVVLEEFSTKA